MVDEKKAKTQPDPSSPAKAAGAIPETVKASLAARKPHPSRKFVPVPVTRAVVIRLIDGVKRI